MKYTILFFAALIFCSCSKGEDNSVSSSPNNMTKANPDFPFDLYKTESADKPDKNVIISPLSMEVALKMLINGTDGTATEDIQKTLRTTTSVSEINTSTKSTIDNLLSSDEKVDINIANSAWLQNGFDTKESYVKALKDYFDAEVYNRPLDNGTASEINDWVSTNTKGKIKKIIEAFSGQEVFVLINAIYFKSSWTSQFDAANTTKESFTLLNGSDKKVDMMMQKSDYMEHVVTDEYQAVSFPFASAKFEMVAIMPKDVASFNQFEHSMSLEKFNTIRESMKAGYLDISLPKFKVEYENSFTKTLSSMGMSSLFYSASDFSNMTNEPNVKVSDVLQKVYFECQEEGVEAAAVTAVIGVTTGEPPPGTPLMFNQPFIIVLKEKSTNSILFLGKVIEP